jgi:hypothetical protein
MGIFGKSTSNTHEERKRLKELKGQKGKEARKERRQIRRMTKKERDTVMTQAAKDKVSTIINGAGKIIGVNAMKQVPVYKQRIQKGKCPFCGEPPERRGHICDSCKGEISSMPSAHEINNTNKSKGLGKGIPDGQNLNGTMYCKNGHRVFFQHAHGIYDCSQGCNS